MDPTATDPVWTQEDFERMCRDWGNNTLGGLKEKEERRWL